MAFEPFTKDELPTMENFNKKLQEIWSGSARIETGSYDGTGGYGNKAPTEVVVGFRPVFLIVYTNTVNVFGTVSGSNVYLGSNFGIFSKDLTKTYVRTNEVAVSFSENVISFYVVSGNNPHDQYNGAGVKYNYIAIG